MERENIYRHRSERLIDRFLVKIEKVSLFIVDNVLLLRLKLSNLKRD
jgi:hypothetical protein